MRSKISIVIFIAIAGIFLYVANLVVYEALASIFFITAPVCLISLGISLSILSGSFIAVTILGMKYYNAFTRLYSMVTSVWIGFFVYLFFASTAYGILIIFPIGALHAIGAALIICACVISIYGIFHSRNIRITEVSVPLRNTPSQWVGKKAIWISDLHLGQVRGSAFAHSVVEKIKAIPHDIIFIGGDLFDGTTAPDLDKLIAPLKELSAPHGAYFITGNHEEFGSSGAFISAVGRAGVRILQDKMIEIDGVQFIGVDYHTASDAARFKEILSGLNIDAEKASVLLKHEPKDLDVAREAGISLQISGHTHRAQMWPLGYIAHLVYKGYSYGLKKLGEMHVYTSSGVGTWGPPMRVGTDAEVVVFEFTK
jgi:predicted MPP superfamily phosphohydrolase